MIVFLDKWQTLIGSALGPFLAVILSAIGFWIKSAIEKWQKYKECLRRIEIGITQSLDDTYKTKQRLKFFITRLRVLINEIREINDDHHFSLQTIHFPTTREIYRDIDAPNFLITSYYLHNKMLWADSGVKEINETLGSLKKDFQEIQRKNELLIILMKQNQHPKPEEQRIAYADSLEEFTNAIDAFIERFINDVVEIMAQIKIYNQYLRKKRARWFLWKHEGTKFKYFRNKAEQMAFAMSLDSLERIDKIIEKEVKVLIETINKTTETMKREKEQEYEQTKNSVR